MNKYIDICLQIGGALGKISLIVPIKMHYFIYRWKREFITSRYKHKFKSFGEKSLIAPNSWLLHLENVKVGNNSSIQSNCIIETCPNNSNPLLTIGNNVSIGEYTHITCANNIQIGNGVLTGRFVLITDNAHGKSIIKEMIIPPLKRDIYSKGGIEIGDNVWIGDKATILPNVKIGHNAIIAANSVVSKDVPPFTVVAGNPAKVIKMIE